MNLIPVTGLIYIRLKPRRKAFLENLRENQRS